MKKIDNSPNQVRLVGWAMLACLISIGFVSCIKKQDNILPTSSDEASKTDMNKLIVSPDFQYNTTDFVKVNVTAKDKNGKGIGGVVFQILDLNPQEDAIAQIIGTGVTSSNGDFESKITIPNYIKKIYITPNYIGLLDVVEGSIANGSVSVDLMAKASSIERNTKNNRIASSARTEAAPTYSFLGTWNSSGVPNYLEPISDDITAAFLADVNIALPENRPVPIYHPEYINTSNETDIILNDSAAVWITFVHEGAGWRNALGFYSYNIANPPTSVAQISKHTIIFPNASYQGSGGGLQSGNKVKIGTFSKNTGIGWFIVANGWNGSTVGAGNYIHYSEPTFNTETNVALKPHMVLLKDDSRSRILIGFEDTKRDEGADDDFNDAIFYVSANPYAAIVTQNVVTMPTLIDTDNDGISDAFDMYPRDPLRGFDSYFPAKNTFGSLCFEDLWPAKGDYDFNDLVVNYNFLQVLNAQNQLVELKGNFVVKAIGASYRNGFGFQFPIAPDKIASAIGSVISGSLVRLSANGTEEGQDNATIIVFDNPEAIIHRTGGTYFNTESTFTKGNSDTVKLAITFSNPINVIELGAIPFNSFIIVNQVRGNEVHLIDNAPTKMANITKFGTLDDFSAASVGKYYKTSNNLPFAINIPADFDYPIEKTPIINAHLKFGNWAESGGITFPDWYKNNTGYRDVPKVYKK